ncbi:MAG: phosphopantothenoylcysteine decarboxylase [Ruminococcaceae bacterium]|nr:phosphopantothenoylcysteine decarboxylase [Oscillospiraceae bacterium]
MKRIILGVTGAACAPKAVELARKLTENGYAVDAILSVPAGASIVQELEKAAGRTVYAPSSGDGGLDEGDYLALANDADLAVVVPASAAAIAKLSAGIADDLLTATLLALEDGPVLLCPGMDAATYRNPITQRNRRELENLGYYFVAPKLTESGKLVLAEVDRILEKVGDMLDPECWGAYI